MDKALHQNNLKTRETMSFMINDITKHGEHIARASGMIGALWDHVEMRRILSELNVRISIGVFSLINDIVIIISQGHDSTINDIDTVNRKKYEIITSVDVLVNYFTTLHTLGYISGMNRDIMVRELGNLNTKINNLYDVLYIYYQGQSMQSVSENLRDIDQVIKDTREKNIKNHTSQQGQYHTEIESIFTKPEHNDIKDTSHLFIKDMPVVNNPENTILKDTENLKDIVKDMPMSLTKSDKQIDMQLEIHRRKQSIIELLKTKHSIPAHELGILFPQYSRKTLQRTMADLTHAGIIKKSGEKRWSEYILMNTDH